MLWNDASHVTLLANFDFSYAYALNFINRCFGSLFWQLGVPIGSLFHKKLGPYFKAWGSLLVLVTMHWHDNFGHYFVGRGPQFQNDFSGPKWRGWVGSPTWEKVPKSHSFFLSGCGSPNNFLRKIPFTCVTVTWPRADLCPHLKIRQMLFCQVALKWLFMIMLLNVPKLRTQ